MGRPRTGSLAWRPSGYAARLSTSKGRRFVPLNTHDEGEAKRKLAGMVTATDASEETMEVYADRWLDKRKADGVVMHFEETTYWRLHARPILGPLKLLEVKPEHIREILDRLVQAKKSKGTIQHVRGFLHRMLSDAWRANLIPEDPTLKVKLPKIREVRKERAILSDEEFVQFVNCNEADEEIRVLTACSRILGGARTGDLHKLDWTLFDVPTFGTVIIARNKTGTPQRLGVPEAVRPLITRWWTRHGSPLAGPVFPCRCGRTGEAKGRGTSYARRLRRELLRAGITRAELFTATEYTRPVDFHSCRRAFVSALGREGVPLQAAMKLSGHTNARTHAGYIVGVQEIPLGVVPDLSTPSARTEGEKGAPGRTRTCDQRLRRPPSPNNFAKLPETSGTSDPLASRLVEVLGDDPLLLAQVLGKLLRKG